MTKQPYLCGLRDPYHFLVFHKLKRNKVRKLIFIFYPDFIYAYRLVYMFHFISMIKLASITKKNIHEIIHSSPYNTRHMV